MKNFRAIFSTIKNTQEHVSLPTASFYPNSGIVKKDYQYARDFLLSYKNNLETFKTYRREIERFLQWSWLIARKSILKHTRKDIETFIMFCLKPPKKWVGPNQVPRFIINNGRSQPNPKWRPFVTRIKYNKNLSEAAIRVIFAIIGSFYNFLLEESKIDVNPVILIKQKRAFLLHRQQFSSCPIRRISQIQWLYLVKAAKIITKEKPKRHGRTLFILQALYGMYLRISELVASKRWRPQMNSFHKDNDSNWWFRVIGKGNKERDISVSDEMLEAFKQYRITLNLPPLPSSIDNSPLIPKFIGQGGISDSRYIRELIQDCFDLAYQLMLKDGKKINAYELKIATVHWLRHTGISEDVKTRPREHVRDDAGHSSSAITDKYIDIEKKERARSAKKKKLIIF
ncbi:MAG: site-specific integrase [Coxiellaceae bacterium]|jgi:site-specific recombinase XerD|nr:site-specific integrase [Coxiellaceae bacterium]